MGLYVQAYTLYSSVRPFGCSTILGAIDKTGPTLYIIEPSGVAYVCSRTFLQLNMLKLNLFGSFRDTTVQQ